jgi:hypothetical protein
VNIYNSFYQLKSKVIKCILFKTKQSNEMIIVSRLFYFFLSMCYYWQSIYILTPTYYVYQPSMNYIYLLRPQPMQLKKNRHSYHNINIYSFLWTIVISHDLHINILIISFVRTNSAWLTMIHGPNIYTIVILTLLRYVACAPERYLCK